jgi:hypothetical protein
MAISRRRQVSVLQATTSTGSASSQIGSCQARQKYGSREFAQRADTATQRPSGVAAHKAFSLFGPKVC